MAYYLQILTYCAINAIVALGLYLPFSTGQLVISFGAFAGIGGITSGLLSSHDQTPFVVAIVAGGLVSGIIALVISMPFLRLQGFYLAIATLGFGEVARVIAINTEALGGALGLRGVPLHTSPWYTFAILLLLAYVLNYLFRSPLGTILKAIRDNEIAVEASGINVAWYKLLTVAVGASIAGIGGGFFIHYVGVLDPRTLGFHRSIEILLYVVLGGIRTHWGSIVGAILVTVLPEALRLAPADRMLLYGGTLVLIVIARPEGILVSKSRRL